MDFPPLLQRSPFLFQRLLVLWFAHRNAVLIAWLNLSFTPGKSQHTDLTPGLFHLACDPAPLTFSSFSMLACWQCFPWPSCHFHLLLVPAEPDLFWGQLCWMGTSGASGSWAEAQLCLENTFPLNIKGAIFQTREQGSKHSARHGWKVARCPLTPWFSLEERRQTSLECNMSHSSQIASASSIVLAAVFVKRKLVDFF